MAVHDTYQINDCKYALKRRRRRRRYKLKKQALTCADKTAWRSSNKSRIKQHEVLLEDQRMYYLDWSYMYTAQYLGLTNPMSNALITLIQKPQQSGRHNCHKNTQIGFLISNFFLLLQVLLLIKINYKRLKRIEQ